MPRELDKIERFYQVCLKYRQRCVTMNFNYRPLLERWRSSFKNNMDHSYHRKQICGINIYSNIFHKIRFICLEIRRKENGATFKTMTIMLTCWLITRCICKNVWSRSLFLVHVIQVISFLITFKEFWACHSLLIQVRQLNQGKTSLFLMKKLLVTLWVILGLQNTVCSWMYGPVFNWDRVDVFFEVLIFSFHLLNRGTGVLNLFGVAGRITSIFMKYGRQLVHDVLIFGTASVLLPYSEPILVPHVCWPSFCQVSACSGQRVFLNARPPKRIFYIQWRSKGGGLRVQDPEQHFLEGGTLLNKFNFWRSLKVLTLLYYLKVLEVLTLFSFCVWKPYRLVVKPIKTHVAVEWENWWNVT